MTTTQEYKIHGSTIFIKGNGIISHYKLNPDTNEVFKLVTDMDGNDRFDAFHTVGDLPMNTEAKLINELRLKGEF